MIVQVQKVTRAESLGYLASDKTGAGPCPQGDRSSPSISLVLQFRFLTFHIAGCAVLTLLCPFLPGLLPASHVVSGTP